MLSMSNQYPHSQPPHPQQPYPQQQGWQPVNTGNPFADQAPNPYAAPLVATPYQLPPKLAPFAGLWRQGNVLVMHKMAPLPDICLKSNQPATRRLKRTMYWHPPYLYILLLISWPIYIIVALIMQKNATLHVALTEEWFARRRTRMLIAWGIVLASVALLVGGIALSDTLGDSTVLAVLGAIVLFFGGLIFGLIACRLVWAARITDEYVWLNGVHPEFLNRLEIWPYNI
jgi:hypothetical protein